IMALEAGSGRVQWTRESAVAPVTLTAAGRRVYFHDGEKVTSVDASSGRDVWSSKPIPRWKPMHVLFGPTLVAYEDVVLFAGGEKMDPIRGGDDTMTALSAETGETLWTAPHPPSGYASSEDLFVVDGLVWCGVTTNRRDSGVFTGRDLRTGEVVREFPADDWPHMPHHRCHRAKATSNYVLTSRTGIEFVDLRSQHWTVHHWVRGSCNYGIMPSNGLVYAPPHSCACYPLAKLNGFNALAPARDEGRGTGGKSDESPRLQPGLAYGSSSTRPSPLAPHPSDWPTYRHDAGRSGSTNAVVPARLDRVWQAEVGGKLSAVVIADNRVFVSAVDLHTVHALDAASGRSLWSFTAGGRVDSPPTVWQGRVLFGSADGSVYCLRAADGALVWRFRAAPEDRRLMAFEQVESAWPVHGSVLVREGVVYCVAGRSMWLDGGMRLVRLDARSGARLSETVLDDKYPGTEDNLQRDIKWPNLPVALPDVLSSDGRHVYMRSQPFDLAGKRIDVITPRNYDEQRGDTAHLFSPSGFLDDAWWHRSYWLYGRSFIGGAGGWYLAGYQAPAGRILVVDESSVYGFGRAPLRVTGTPNAYHLFACSKEPELINPNPNRPPRKQGSSIYGQVVPTRLEYQWSEAVPLLVRAMVATDQTLFLAGPPEMADEFEVYGSYGDPKVQARAAEHVAAFEGKKGAVLMAVSKADGAKQAAYRLPSAPVFDGMAAAAGRLFLSTSDGAVLCLGGGEGEPLQPAPDVNPGPVPALVAGFVETKSHPDFQHLATIGITSSELGYRMRTAPREVGLALEKLAAPLTRRAEFRVRIRPNPGAASPDTPGNGFLAFGDAPDDGQLVKCGFRISGKRLYVVQGPLLDGQAVSKPIDVKANEVAELHVIVDLDTQKVTATMHGETVEAPLERQLDAVTWVGCCVTSVTSDFSPIEVTGE
ncbi:MAG: PQQ-binding-like beta-propeller repeat protein, partial [Planctomycetota bacterium]